MTRLSPPPRERGAILVTALFMLVLVGALTASMSAYVGTGLAAVGAERDRAEAQQAMQGALELAMLAARRSDATPEGRLSVRLGGWRVSVARTPEAARIDLNRAPRAMVEKFFTVMGADAGAAASYAQRLDAWRTPLKAGESGDALRHGPLPDLSELTLAAGIDPDFVARLAPFASVASGESRIDVRSAARSVILALPGVDAPRAERILAARRQGADALGAALAGITSLVTFEAPRTHRVTLDADRPGHGRLHAEAVVLLLEDDSEPYRLLSWTADAIPPRVVRP